MPTEPTAEPAAAPTLAETRAYFSGDHFATLQCGAVIDEAGPGRAVCSCALERHHRNAMGNVMGGAVFTLADFACAVASNEAGRHPSVTAACDIQYIGSAKGKRLIATCEADRSGRRLGFYTTRVEDELGTLVALAHATCLHV